MAETFIRNLRYELLALDGEPRDLSIPAWAQDVRSIFEGPTDHFMYVGDSVESGTVEIEVGIPRVYLICKAINRRLKTYKVAVMYPSGRLAMTDIQTNDAERGWALRLKRPIAALLKSHVYDWLIDQKRAVPTSDGLMMTTPSGEISFYRYSPVPMAQVASSSTGAAVIAEGERACKTLEYQARAGGMIAPIDVLALINAYRFVIANFTHVE